MHRLIFQLKLLSFVMNTSVRHLAIIPDGNRTRAKNQWIQTFQWHFAWQKNSLDLMHRVFSNTQIQVFTIRWLSTENLLRRSQQELDYLADIYESSLDHASVFMKEHKISLRRIWSKEWMTPRLIKVLEDAVDVLTFDSKKTICLGINYGGHDEILRGIAKWNEAWADTSQLTAQWFERYLDLYGLPAVDLVVRTKAKMATRLSWYLLRWVWYAELYFTDILFPDFWNAQLQDALVWFEEVKEYRNFGK